MKTLEQLIRPHLRKLNLVLLLMNKRHSMKTSLD